MLNFKKHASYRNVRIEMKSREIIFLAIQGKILLKQEFSTVINIHEHKRYYHTFDNSLLFTETFRTLHKSFHAKIITSGFFRVSTGRWYNAIRVRAKPQVYRFNYSWTLLQRSSPLWLHT